jgi:hypothetical protein
LQFFRRLLVGNSLLEFARFRWLSVVHVLFHSWRTMRFLIANPTTSVTCMENQRRNC